MSTFTKIDTITVGSGGASTISFTSIPQTYTDLCIFLSLRADSGSSYNDTRLTINSSSSGYKSLLLYGSTAGQGSANTTAYGYSYWAGGADTPSYSSNAFSGIEIYLPNYKLNNDKVLIANYTMENFNTFTVNAMSNSQWANSSAITSLSFSQDYGSYVQYSTATLYGIKSS